MLTEGYYTISLSYGGSADDDACCSEPILCLPWPALHSLLAALILLQVNVWVGPFFVLSGYVAGYTATELGKYAASSRVKPEGAYTVARVAGYYPLFILVQILFGAMFAYADNFYNGPVATVAHAIISATLTQVCFAEERFCCNLCVAACSSCEGGDSACRSACIEDDH